MYHWYDFVGNVGVFLIVATYLLLLLNRLDSNGIYYSLLNGVGASLVIVSLTFDFNLSAFIVEAFWVTISLIGVVRALLRDSAPITAS